MSTVRISASIPGPASKDASSHRYLVEIGEGAKDLLPKTIAEVMNLKPKKLAVVYGADLADTAGAGVKLDKGLLTDFQVQDFRVEEGEPSKNFSQVERLCAEFSDFGLNRSDMVVAVGGGLVLDLVGFAAGIYHRGLPVIYIPTTLLAQVDAAIGGKTGVNLQQGKNLIGVFSHPLAVLMDTSVLKTLPKEEFQSGMGEVVKYVFLVDSLHGLDEYFAELGLGHLNPKDLNSGDLESSQNSTMSLEEKIACCVAVKLFVASKDEKESGLRALLNYGHTLGHALEVADRFNMRHGEAVSIGIAFAAELAFLLGRIDEARLQYHKQVLEASGLPFCLDGKAVDTDEILELIFRDKKARDSAVFVLDGKDGMDPAIKVEKEVILQALDRIK